jgi:hypothetical protein
MGKVRVVLAIIRLCLLRQRLETLTVSGVVSTTAVS